MVSALGKAREYVAYCYFLYEKPVGFGLPSNCLVYSNIAIKVDLDSLVIATAAEQLLGLIQYRH